MYVDAYFNVKHFLSRNSVFLFRLQDPTQLRENIFELTATLLACGIDAEKSTIFLQSSIPQHSELCWILSCLCTMNRLSHLPQFKEKSAQVRDVQTGLFLYPVLQAADILIHKYGFEWNIFWSTIYFN